MKEDIVTIMSPTRPDAIQPLTDAELAIGCYESPQALDQLKHAYQGLRAAYESQGVELRAAQMALAYHDVGVLVGPSSPDCAPAGWRLRHHATCHDPTCGGCKLDWLTRHLLTCHDPSCDGCKKCQRCGTLTLAYGFEDHLCFNCRHPPSD